MKATTIGLIGGAVAFAAGAGFIYAGVEDKEDQARARIKEIIGSALLLTGVGTIVGSGLKALESHASDYSHENPRLSSGSDVQSLIFPRSWGVRKAKAWAKSHGYKYGKVDVTSDTIRLRQESPSKFERLRTVRFGRGIKAVMGFH